MSGTNVGRFSIEIADAALDDLRMRLGRTRWPGDALGLGWERGTDLDFMRQLLRAWHDDYDWREHESTLNRFRHYRAEIDGTTLHFIHEPAASGQGVPIVLTHGWPSSFYEFTKLIPRLTEPQRFGGNERSAFDVVVPSLPGYAFSGRLEPPDTFNRVPELWMRLMSEVLGYPQFMAHGGDIGAMVTNRLALEYPEALIGIHVTFPPEPSFAAGTPEPSDSEADLLRRRPGAIYWGSGYAHIAATRPQTVAYALTDSPAGLAAWMVDKLSAWSDCDGDLYKRFTRDELLTWISLYWLTGNAGSTLDPYWDWALGSGGLPEAWQRRSVPRGVDGRPLDPGEQINVPAAVAIFGRGPVTPPREWAERSYSDLRRWTRYESGGHFAAWEEPDLLAADVRALLAQCAP